MNFVRSSTLAARKGTTASAAALPWPGNVRWTPARKLTVLVAIRRGVITAADACDRYMMSPEELAAWDEALDHRGVAGLYAKALGGRGKAAPQRNRKVTERPEHDAR
jgi:hypothetical protein